MNTKNAKPDFYKPDFGLENSGLTTTKTVYWNYSTPALYEEAIKRGEGNVVYGGPFCVSTGKHTGRSPKDRFFVKTKNVEGKVTVNFIVDENGKVSDVNVAEGVNKDLDREALRVCRLLPDFIPATVNGEPVKVLFSLPIRFKIPAIKHQSLNTVQIDAK